jgi:signal transduction histidine kinase
VLLGRLRVREKLTLLVLLPLVAMILATIPFALDRVQTVVKDRRSADVVGHTVQLSNLIQEVQQERLLSVGFLSTRSGRNRLIVRAAQVDDMAATVRAQLARHMTSTLDYTLDQVDKLRETRPRVLRRSISPDLAFVAYSDVIARLINAVGLSSDADARTPTGRQEVALDALIRHDEASAAAGAALLVPLSGRGVNARAVSLVAGASAAESSQEQVFFKHASPIARSQYMLVQEGPARQYVKWYQDLLVNAPADAIRLSRLPSALLPKVEAATELSRLVQLKIANDARRQAAGTARAAAVGAIVVIVLALLLLALVVVWSILVARAIATPLRQLTLSAEEVAEVARAELTRVSDTEETKAGVSKPHLVPVPVATADEMGELATAFNRVQQVASELVERQLVSRRNVATMFGNVGRRTQNLVGRQLAMIDALECSEQDPAMLERLYRLDHVSSRLRRNANSLVVLSGTAEPSIASEPLSVGDAVRSALGEIEDFQRVRLHRVDVLHLAPDAATDVVLLLAELLENSTSFSPPHTEVEVSATRYGGDCLIRIVDRGIGMTEEQLGKENARLVERERLDLAPTDVLGLFVVGRLARQHGIRVTLSPTEGSGVTAAVSIPDRLLVRGRGADGGARAADGPGWSRGHAETQPPKRPARVPATLLAAGQRPVLLPPATATVASGPAHTGPDGPAGPEAPTAPGVPGLGVPGLGVPGLGVRGLGVPPAAEVRPSRIMQRVPEAGAQLPETGGQPVSWGSPEAPEAARQTIEDFQEGVARAEADQTDDTEVSLLERWERLRRRVPGAPVPVAAAPPIPAPLAPQRSDTARALVEEFEQGVRRALDNLAAVTARHAHPHQPSSSADSPPLLASPRPGAEPGRNNGSRASGDGRGTASEGAMAAAAGGGAGPGNAPAEGIRLTRRVPGAQLPDTGAPPGQPAPSPAQPPPAPAARAQDPEAARALVDEFEAGVARAMWSAGGGPGTTATTEGDEG